jgi:hypothetical protein
MDFDLYIYVCVYVCLSLRTTRCSYNPSFPASSPYVVAVGGTQGLESSYSSPEVGLSLSLHCVLSHKPSLPSVSDRSLRTAPPRASPREEVSPSSPPRPPIRRTYDRYTQSHTVTYCHILPHLLVLSHSDAHTHIVHIPHTAVSLTHTHTHTLSTYCPHTLCVIYICLTNALLFASLRFSSIFSVHRRVLQCGNPSCERI